MKILYLYPNLMNLYGDYANIAVLEKHLEDQGVSVDVDKIDVGKKYNIFNYDLVYMGSGTEKNQIIALDDLMSNRKQIIEYIESGKTLLFTGNAMELLGKSIDDHEAIGYFDFTVTTTSSRFTGDVIVNNDVMGELVGFINKSTIIKGGNSNALFTYVFKEEGIDDNLFEGYYYKNTYGTHLIGPVLLKNPQFLKRIMKCVLPYDFAFKNIEYKYEQDAYKVTLNELKNR